MGLISEVISFKGGYRGKIGTVEMNVHVTDEKIFSISNFLVPEKGANTHEELRHTFVPYTEPGELPLPNMAKLIGQRHRYYLHPVVDEAAYHEEKFEAHRADLERAGEKTKDKGPFQNPPWNPAPPVAFASLCTCF